MNILILCITLILVFHVVALRQIPHQTQGKQNKQTWLFAVGYPWARAATRALIFWVVTEEWP